MEDKKRKGKKNNLKENKVNYKILHLPIATALGIILGIVFNRIALGVIVGVAFGTIMDAIATCRDKK